MKKPLFLILPLMIFFIGIGYIPYYFAQGAENNNSQRAASAFSQNLNKIYFGGFAPGLPEDMSNITTMEGDAKKNLAIIMWYTDWARNFNPQQMDAARNHGSIPMITWMPTSWDPYKYQGTSSPSILKNIYNGNFDVFLTQYAKDAKAWGHPFFIRFGHEMNGSWSPWSEQSSGNKSGDFVKAWRHIHDIFVKNGAKNVSWVWSPNAEGPGTTPLPGLYPGDTYVDWVGIDGYNFGTSQSWSHWSSFTNVFQATYNKILNITKKPILIGEMGSSEVGGNKAQWITSAFGTELPKSFPKIRAVIWFNGNKETDWRIESSTSTQKAFVSAISSSIYTSNQYGSITQSPIPTP